MRTIQRKTLATESRFNRVAVLIPATLLNKRLQQIDSPVNFAQLLKTLFKEHLWVGASAPSTPSKGFVILQILANFNKSSIFFPCVPLFLLTSKNTYKLFLLMKFVKRGPEFKVTTLA